MQHKIPIHLDQPDKFILGLTGRQTGILALGLALGYMVANNFEYGAHLWLLLPAGLCFLCIMLLAVLVAFVRIGHKHLEQWAIIIFLFYASPRIYLWRSQRLELARENEGVSEENETQGEEEEW
jgi:hypothetical protein